MLEALLGNLERHGGRVRLREGARQLAYAPQQAWIQNATLRDNVVFGRAFEPARYAEALASCALGADLAVLPAGDRTEIGERGIK